jgi:Mn2+/Fe2+ NRAMP family transporter
MGAFTNGLATNLLGWLAVGLILVLNVVLLGLSAFS